MFDFHQSVKARSISSNIGTYANRPSASSVVSGSLYFCTDSPLILFSNGTIWQAYCHGCPVTLPAPSDFTTLNSASISSTNGLMTIVFADNDSNVCRGFYRTNNFSGTPWSVEMAFMVSIDHTNASNSPGDWGPFFFDGTKIEGMATIADNATSGRIYLRRWNSASSFNSSADPPNLWEEPHTQTVLAWRKIQDDGSNRNFYLSSDGFNWRLVGSVGRTSFLTANSAGIYGAQQGAKGPLVTLVHWKEGL